jgi:hypothetical protein
MRRPGAGLALALAGLALAPASAPGAPGRAVVAFLPSAGSASGPALLSGDRRIEALGLIDPSEGGYDERQALLDLTQGAWVTRPTYRPERLRPIRVGADGRVGGWAAIVARAAGASARLEPGLLAASVPGGAAYAGDGPRPGPEAVVAADRAGRVAAISLGPAGTLAARTVALLGHHALVVAAVPDLRRLDQILGRRPPDVLVLVLERPPPRPPGAASRAELLGLGASGLPGAGGTLATRTTRRPGLVTGLDVAPTVLRFVGAPVPAAVRGAPITRAGRRDPAALDRLRARLEAIAGRRWPAIDAFLLAWLGLLVLGGAARRGRGVRAMLRVGGLAALWTPSTALLAGALAPTRPVELAVVVGGAFLLAAACDRTIPWPRAPLGPAAVMVVAYVADLGLGSPLISASILGPNPIAGSRFYGVGNELEAALPIVLFAGLAAALARRAPGAREVRAFAAVGLAFTALIAWGRLGADVGAVFTIGGGTTAGALALRGRVTRRTAILACAVPVVSLVALAGLDLVTRAGGHFTGTVLDAGSLGDVAGTIGRKLADAFRQLRRGVMPIDTVVCLAAAAYVLRRPARVLAPVGGAPAWRAFLVGGFAAGVLGSLTNDSGPVLLVISSFGVACVLAYLHGRPPGAGFLPGS